MILIVVKFKVLPEFADSWMEKVGPFTEATRAEPGNLWFDWSRSVEDPEEFVLVEAFREGDAPAEHVNSAHFKAAIELMPTLLQSTPKILNQVVPGEDWNVMGEMTVPDRG